MKNPVLSLVIILFMLMISCGKKVYDTRDYRVETVHGVKTVLLYDRYLGEEQTLQLQFLKSIPKKSLHMYRALCGSDTVSLLDLNPEEGELFMVGESSIIKVRPIRSLKVLYWELPSAPLAYCFEKDTVWFSRDDTSPKYLLMDEGVVVMQAKKLVIDGEEVWKYEDGKEIKTKKLN